MQPTVAPGPPQPLSGPSRSPGHPARPGDGSETAGRDAFHRVPIRQVERPRGGRPGREGRVIQKTSGADPQLPPAMNGRDNRLERRLRARRKRPRELTGTKCLRGKAESKKQKIEMAMNQGRLPEEFRSRTKAFAAATIRCFVKLPKSREEIRILGKQLLRSGTSVAAHIREGSRARSDEEFVSKLSGALQEADETQLWLELLREECGVQPTLTQPLEREASELMAIFTTMINRTKARSRSS